MKQLKKGFLRGSVPFIFLMIASLILLFLGIRDAAAESFSIGVIAFFLGFTSVIYEIQSWRFSTQIFVHYLAMLLTVFPTLLLSGMYSIESLGDVLGVYFLFNKVGIFLFVTTYLISRWRHRGEHGDGSSASRS